MRELALLGISAKSQVSFPVLYKERYAGEYLADLVVQEKLIVELKCLDRFSNEHLAQCINYLKASHLEVAFTHQLSKAESAMETYHTGGEAFLSVCIRCPSVAKPSGANPAPNSEAPRERRGGSPGGTRARPRLVPK